MPADERRWATVLFADLTGYTSLSERMDPEDVQELTHRCAERLASEVRRFGGSVVNVMGDGVLAVFGAPLAHEDDAERAVRAALAIRDCSLATPEGRALQMHVGVNTGEVMAGLVGPAERRDYTVVGDTVNTAARLMAAAPAGCVLVGEETYRATHRTVGYRAVDPVEARGKERPVLAWEALDASTVPEARPLGTAPFVGRADELAVLARIWSETVHEARPRLVTVLGEPGIGKSRLVAELDHRALGDAAVFHGRCLPYGTVLGYWAIATVVKEAAGIVAEDNSGAARAKLGELVAGLIGTGPGRSDGDPSEVARHLALLVGLDVEEDRAVPAGDQRTLHASARRFFEALARRRPLCLLLEDIHWADDALLDLIEHVAARASEAPLMIVTQARPELLEHRPSWGRGVPAHTSLRLEPLDERDGHGLILALCREHGLPSDVAEQVGRGAGGNPLFAEELVATIAERRGGAGHIPSAIKALISARLDALSADQRWMLQLASVVGKHFWEGSVSLLSRRDGRSPTTEHVTELLDALVQKDLVRLQPRSRFRGDLEYSFKHDLIRDVAYEMLPRRERRALHAQAADWLELVEGERVDELLDVLAHHALQADQQPRALGYLTRAAERARRAAAHREEAALLAQAIEIAERLGQDETAADLQARRGRAFFDFGSWADARAELEAALARIPADQPDRRVGVLLDLAGACALLMDTVSERRHATEALTLAERHGRPRLVVAAHGWLSQACLADGDVDGALARYESAVAGSRELGIAPPAVPLVMGAATYYWAGRAREATACARDALTSARERNDTMALMMGFPHLGLALAAEGRYDEAARVFDESRSFGQEHEIFTLLARSIAMSAGFHLDVFDHEGNEALAEEARDMAWTHAFPPSGISASIDLLLNFARRGEVERAEPLLGPVAEAVERAAAWHGWLWKMRLAEARAEIALAHGEWEEAVRWADQAIDRSRTHRRPKYEALGAWTRARTLQALGRTTEAVADLRRATERARSTGDPALLLRVASPLLAIDGDDALATEACAAAERISAALPDVEMRRRFEAAEPVRLARKTAPSDTPRPA